MSVGGLPRAMGLRDVVLFNIAAIVGLRWITTAGKIGPFALVLWLVAMVAFFIPSALAVADLSENDPGEGGLYRWVNSAFGETHGFLAGWGYWVNNLVYYPSLLVTTAAIGAYALGPENVGLADNQLFVAVFSLVVLWLALGLNILGLDVGKWVQNLGAIGTWIPAVVLVVLGAWVLLKFGSATPFEPSQWVPPDFDYSLLAFFATMTFGFAGLELIPVLGGEIRDAARTIRRGILISGALIVFVYIIGTVAILAALPPETVDITNGVPQATAAMELRLGLTGITYIVAVMLVIGNLGGVGAWLAGTARIPFVAGLDRKLPPAFGRVHPKWKSPYVALLVQGGVATLFVLSGLLGSTVETAYLVLLDMTIILYFIPYLYVFAAYLVLLRSRSGSQAPRKAMACMGFLSVLLSIFLAAVPAEQSGSLWLFEFKLWGGVAAFMGVGFWFATRKSHTSVA